MLFYVVISLKTPINEFKPLCPISMPSRTPTCLNQLNFKDYFVITSHIDTCFVVGQAPHSATIQQAVDEQSF